MPRYYNLPRYDSLHDTGVMASEVCTRNIHDECMMPHCECPCHLEGLRARVKYLEAKLPDDEIAKCKGDVTKFKIGDKGGLVADDNADEIADLKEDVIQAARAFEEHPDSVFAQELITKVRLLDVAERPKDPDPWELLDELDQYIKNDIHKPAYRDSLRHKVSNALAWHKENPNGS